MLKYLNNTAMMGLVESVPQAKPFLEEYSDLAQMEARIAELQAVMSQRRLEAQERECQRQFEETKAKLAAAIKREAGLRANIARIEALPEHLRIQQEGFRLEDIRKVHGYAVEMVEGAELELLMRRVAYLRPEH